MVSLAEKKWRVRILLLSRLLSNLCGHLRSVPSPPVGGIHRITKPDPLFSIPYLFQYTGPNENTAPSPPAPAPAASTPPTTAALDCPARAFLP